MTVAGPPIDNDQPILDFDATIGSLAFGIMPVGNIPRVRAGVGSLTAGEVIQSINPPSIVCTDAAGESNLAQSRISVTTGANNLATTQCRTTSSKIKSLVPTFSDGAAALVHGMYGLATLRTQYVHSSGAKPNYYGGHQYVRVPLIGRASSGGLSTILGLIDNPAIKINFPIVDGIPVSANIEADIIGSVAVDAAGNFPRINLKFYVSRSGITGLYSSKGLQTLSLGNLGNAPQISVFPAVNIPISSSNPVPFPITEIIDFVGDATGFTLRIPGAFNEILQTYTAFFTYHMTVGENL